MEDSFCNAFAAPAFTLTCELIGPEPDKREEYLDLLGKVQLAREQQHLPKVQSLLAEASKLLTSLWREVIHNTVTTAGKNDVINQYFQGATYTAAWYLGLKGSGSVSANDTMTSHAGWPEFTPYSGTRPSIVWGATSSGSNTAGPVSFFINASANVTGAFITNENIAGSNNGILYSAADFSVARSVTSGDTLNITPTISFS